MSKQIAFRNRSRVHNPESALYGGVLLGARAAGGSAPNGDGGPAASPEQAAWCEWLSPLFTNGGIYFTGTYSDTYGYPHGLMLTRNVHRDFRRFLKDQALPGRWVCGVEPHRDRAILHLHAVLEGPLTDFDERFMKAAWTHERGWCRLLPVLDGGVSYVTKYALKGDAQAFDWSLS